jgi:hypothetical protein
MDGCDMIDPVVLAEAGWNAFDPSLGTTSGDGQLLTDASDTEYYDWTVNTGLTGHGSFGDSGCDGKKNLQDIGDPAGKAGVEFIWELVEVTAGNKSGTDEGIGFMVANSHTVTTNVATVVGGFYVETADDALQPINPARSASFSKNTIDLDDTVTDFAPAVLHARCIFDDDTAQPKVAGTLSRWVGDDSPEGHATSTTGTAALNGQCLAGPGLWVPAASPAASPRFKVRGWWRWIEEAVVP